MPDDPGESNLQPLLAEGGEYSINPYYPYGKWYFYEQILRVRVYAIFHPKTVFWDVYRLTEDKHQKQELGADGCI
ncbi:MULTISPECIES: hypothetical protein [unclassified Synechocystis]|uniref:hypothetical protein n=1 Tax=unclassified Synechocystis TaxID=2640012 RepID=UPI00041B00A2|nr:MULTISPECIES: hypothetical protein [unclassified Synechocystis]AIE75421.1 hypothetical protein D082_28930 [Synechocystis sp. PCC 6714]